MIKTTALVVAMLAALTGSVAARVDHEAGPAGVILHLDDFAHVSSRDLVEAQRQVTRVYRAAGVRAVWTDGSARTAPPDGAFHVDVALLSKDMVTRTCRSDGIAEQVFGRASRPIGRAFIFYDRIADRATLTASSVAVLLATVIAHEVGHLLLPEAGHSSFGIMRDSLEGRIVRVPLFTGDEATALRKLLATTRGH